MIKIDENVLINKEYLVEEGKYISNIEFCIEKPYIDFAGIKTVSFEEYKKDKGLPEQASLIKLIGECPEYVLKPREENFLQGNCYIFTANGNTIALGNNYYKIFSKIPHIIFYSDGEPYHQVYLVIKAGLMRKVIGVLMPCVTQ